MELLWSSGDWLAGLVARLRGGVQAVGVAARKFGLDDGMLELRNISYILDHSKPMIINDFQESRSI